MKGAKIKIIKEKFCTKKRQSIKPKKIDQNQTKTKQNQKKWGMIKKMK